MRMGVKCLINIYDRLSYSPLPQVTVKFDVIVEDYYIKLAK